MTRFTVVVLLTFPGVIVHELAHQLFCGLFRVAVLDACYFRRGAPAGFLVTEQPRQVSAQLLIGIGPFLVNSLLGALVAFPGTLAFRLGVVSALDLVLVWLGVSLAIHALPSQADADSLLAAVAEPGIAPLWQGVVLLVAGLSTAAAAGVRFGLDGVYGVVVAFLLPALAVGALV